MPREALVSPHLMVVEGMMKQGMIVYVIGGRKLPEGLEPGIHFEVMSQPAGLMEIVVSQQGILELDDAWHFLLNEGCDTIHLLVTLAEPDRLHPLWPPVRLAGADRGLEDFLSPYGERRALH